MQTCYLCSETKPLTEFAISSKNVTGHDYRCKACVRQRSKTYAQRPKIVITSQICSCCLTDKPTSDFSRDSGKQTGYATQCKACSHIKQVAYRHRIYAAVELRQSMLTPEQLTDYLTNTLECRTCHEHKPLTEFHRQKGSVTGYRNQCKPCRVVLEEEYRLTHVAQAVARVDQWRLDHPEKQQLLALAYANRRRMRLHALPYTWTIAEREFMRGYWSYSCAVCGNQEGFFWTLADDHWIPVTASACPGTVATNMIPLCHGTRGCNNSKNDTLPTVWLRRKYEEKKAIKIEKTIAAYFDCVRQHNFYPINQGA